MACKQLLEARSHHLAVEHSWRSESGLQATGNVLMTAYMHTLMVHFHQTLPAQSNVGWLASIVQRLEVIKATTATLLSPTHLSLGRLHGHQV